LNLNLFVKLLFILDSFCLILNFCFLSFLLLLVVINHQDLDQNLSLTLQIPRKYSQNLNYHLQDLSYHLQVKINQTNLTFVFYELLKSHFMIEFKYSFKLD